MNTFYYISIVGFTSSDLNFFTEWLDTNLGEGRWWIDTRDFQIAKGRTYDSNVLDNIHHICLQHEEDVTFIKLIANFRFSKFTIAK